jgi:hypothetical protein
MVDHALSIMRGEPQVGRDQETGKEFKQWPTIREQQDAREYLTNRAWGRPASEVLDDAPTAVQVNVDTSQPALLALAVRTLARALFETEARTASGYAPTGEALAATSKAASTMVSLSKMEHELSKQGPAAQLSDEALVSEVLRVVPLEKLRAAIEAREPKP